MRSKFITMFLITQPKYLLDSFYDEKFGYVIKNHTFGANGTFRCCMVSVANLCRSPIMAAVFTHVAKELKIDHIWKFDSAAIGVWYLGCHVDFRAVEILARHGINQSSEQKVKQIRPDMFKDYDYIIAADRQVLKVMLDRTPYGYKGIIYLLTWFDPLGAENLIDPFFCDISNYTLFEDVYNITLRSSYEFFRKHKDPYHPVSIYLP